MRRNIRAEKITLGALILDDLARPEVLSYLRPGDFCKRAHQIIYQAIFDLHRRNEVIDLLTLLKELAEGHFSRNCGGMRKVIYYIARIARNVSARANVKYYAQIVQECSGRRGNIPPEDYIKELDEMIKDWQEKHG